MAVMTVNYIWAWRSDRRNSQAAENVRRPGPRLPGQAAFSGLCRRRRFYGLGLVYRWRPEPEHC
jgi:hypothetical protein